MILVKLILVITLLVIVIQDNKERAVYWFLFPIVGLLLSFLHFSETSINQLLITASINSIVVTIILFILFSYTKYIAKQKFLNVSFGLGDMFFFYAFALGFPTYTFLLLFSCSILFSMILHFIVPYKKKKKSIPLAGFMSLFLLGILVYNEFWNTTSLYII